MENKNGQGIFLGVVGVATLVVAIIGATFAFFSAQAQSGDGDIAGNTLNVQSIGLTLTVEKLAFNGTAANSNDLVPAVIGTSGTTSLQEAMTAKCEKGDYTGCHLYRITATSSTAVSSAQLQLTLNADKLPAQWRYAIFEGTETNGSGTTLDGLTVGTVGTAPTAFTGLDTTPATIYSGAVSATATIRYMLIYVENENTTQNDTSNATTDVTGTYSGTVSLNGAGAGQVVATFTA